MQDYHAAIREYERRIASGEITFDDGESITCPGQEESSASMASFIQAHVALEDGKP